MPYSDFKNIHQVQLEFNLNLEENRNLFSEINPIKPSNYLQQTLEEYVPFITIVEAKNENIKDGLAQCAAEMIAGQIFNERENNQIPIIYGAVSTGTNWKFLTLEKKRLSIDKIEYSINQIDKILGILLSPINNILANKNLTN